MATGQSKVFLLASLGLASLLGTGCSTSTISGHAGYGAGSSASGPAATSSGTTGAQASSGTTQAPGSSGTGSTGTGSTTGNGAASSTNAASTTGAATLPPIVDGGYVFCQWPGAPGGEASWQCELGTYTCDLRGDAGNCLQCQSDADCADQSLPTYDPNRPHCDLASGVRGYQNFCQQCVKSADCAGNPAGPVCNSNLPAGLLAPAIDILGFESCGGATTDCRQASAPACGLNQTCNQTDGVCTNRSPSCFSDADCAGYFAAQNLPAPHCAFGMCSPCAEAPCSAGCVADQDCIDAGLTCLRPGGAPAFCGLPCAAPSAPACPVTQPYCEPDSGFCQSCSSDDQCPRSTAPSCAPSGFCACTGDSQCPAGLVCYPRDSFGTCSTPLAGCTPESCTGFCDWQTGDCVPISTLPECVTDYDCTTFASSGGDFCVSGKCVGCRDNNDCVAASVNPAQNFHTRCCLAGEVDCDSPTGNYVNTCVEFCRSNADCIGSWNGPICLIESDAGDGECEENACASDADCVGDSSGSYCDFDGGLAFYSFFHDGTCDCRTASDCGPGLTCPDGYCTPYCFPSPDCAPGYFCDPSYVCRPRCDDGGACSGSNPVCDTADVEHQNGEVLDGSVPGLMWCYGCLTSADCPDGQGCSASTHACVTCQQASDCASGACFDGVCLTACDAGACSGGQVCDTLGAAYPIPNFCFQCLDPIDCPDGQGCNSWTHRCGGCVGPTAYGGSSDCPPGDFCSTYWSVRGSPSGACLQTCDARACPPDRPICRQLLQLSNEHHFCFGCLQDADCADAGPGAWCDTSVRQTFTCQLPVD